MSNEYQDKILDVCCGSRMFWFNKKHPDVVYCDIREEEHTLCDGRKLSIKPDIIADFRSLPFADNTFKHIVFDPPHMRKLGERSWMRHKYGVLGPDWRNDLKQGFSECMRVLQPKCTLVFKWNELQISTTEVLKAIGHEPLYGHPSGRREKTHWMVFIKSPAR